MSCLVIDGDEMCSMSCSPVGPCGLQMALLTFGSEYPGCWGQGPIPELCPASVGAVCLCAYLFWSCLGREFVSGPCPLT